MAAEDQKKKWESVPLLQYFTENGKWRSHLAGAGLVGILLIFLSGYLPGDSGEEQEVQLAAAASETERYAQELEREAE